MGADLVDADVASHGSSKRALFAVLSLVMLAVGISILIRADVRPGGQVPFDAAKWKADRRGEVSGIRRYMADTLIRNHTLDGRTLSQVLELLGTPDQDQSAAHPRRIAYELGPERQVISIDSEWLDVEFNKEGRVTRVTSGAD